MKVLILHGYQNNSKILFYQSKLLRSILKYNFTIPNAPNVSCGKPKNINTKFFKSPYFHWYGTNLNDLDNSITYISSLGPFDGIIGFSQGSAMSLYMFDIIKPKFFISIVGVNPNSNPNKSYNIPYNLIEKNTINKIKSYNIPSYHLIGINDPNKIKSLKLLDMFENPKVSYFNGGHEFPSIKDKNEYIKCNKFLKELNI